MTPSHRVARMRLPPWLWGNDVLSFAREAELHLHSVDASAYLWDVETLERYEERSPRFFDLRPVANRSEQPDNWDLLASLPPTGVTHGIPRDPVAAEEDRIESEGTPTAAFAWAHLRTTAAEEADLVAAVQSVFASLRALRFEDGSEVFPYLGVWFVRGSESLSRRTALARVLLRVEEEPELLTTKPDPSERGFVFGSARYLQTDLAFGYDAYIAPLLLCLSPWIWALGAGRAQGLIVYDFGSCIVGRHGQPSEPLQIYLPSAAIGGTERPAIGRAEIAATLRWWIAQLNELFSEVTDVANYVDRGGVFQARGLFEFILSLEQLGRRIQGILGHDRDHDARRLLSFAALDTLEGLGAVSFDDACQLDRAERALTTLEAALPPAVKTMLLPLPRRGVEALRACQDGFFLPSRVTAEGVRLPDKRSGERTLTKEQATARYLRVLRNAIHGFRGRGDADRRRDEVLLAAHDGKVPGDLALLPYLYWLEMLAQPDLSGVRLRHRRARQEVHGSSRGATFTSV
jgi:hypothetical protein